MNQKIYRSIFWLGYIMVFVAAFVPFKDDFHKITINIVSFKFHFDQVLHSIVYFIICLYFPAGQYLGLTLFKNNSFRKFLFVILVLATVTEVVQLAVPSRAYNIFDWVANVIGIGVGIAIVSLAGMKARRELSRE
ncbi:MAG: VanZ family protein [Bacteroidales bacterium]|nr:VanZ family protein [Bacteroidales bacterium]